MTAWAQVTTSEPATTASVSLRCWGDFALTDCANGANLKPRGRKARALLVYLALHSGRPVSRERLTGLLWGDRGEEQARASLRQAILELKPLASGEFNALAIERDHLTLRPGALVTDIDQMRDAVAAANFERFLEMLPESDERLFGNLDGIDEGFDDWLAIERSRQLDALVTLIADASAAALSQGQTRQVRALHARRREFDPAVASLPESEIPLPGSAPSTAERLPVQGLIPAARPGIKTRTLGPIVLFAALVALLVLAAGAWFFKSGVQSTAATVAVLPFKSLSQDNASFADGLSEEITSQLARQPGLGVAGRTSAAQFRDGSVGVAEIGRKLRVSYVLEGSVRSAGDRIRVNVALTKTADGLQLWSETFDGKLDDVLAIQYRIGSNVARALNLKLTGSGPPTGSLATNGQVYSLYLTARGLIRERNPNAFALAHEKLQKALALDPNFAPAWSSLAQIENPGGVEPDAARTAARAIAHAKRALALAPDLAEAHGVLGMLIGFDRPLGQQHIERAAALDPSNAEFQYWLGAVYEAKADFGRMFDAYRRAYALDPLWSYAQGAVVRSAWEMGHQDEAQAYVRRIETDGSAHQAHLIRAVLAHARGDLSEEARELAAAGNATTDPGRRADSDWRRGMVFEQLGLFNAAYEARRRSGMKDDLVRPEADPYVQIRQGKLPTISELSLRNRNVSYSWRDLGYVGRATKLFIDNGRARDIVSLYDGEGILLVSRRGPPALPARVFEDGPVIAAALRAAGRNEEVDRMLAQLNREIAAALRRSGARVPPRFLAFAAQTWAMLGRDQAALSALERATANGWLYAYDLDDSSLADFGDEPAFRSLRGQPRFEAIRTRINAGLVRERQQTLASARG